MAVTLHAHTMSAVLSGNRGAVGVGIADITFNDDYTMTITLTDGSTYTSGNLRGAQGIPGIDAEYDGEELVITTGDHTETDGGEVSTIRVKGEARVIRDRITEEIALAEYPTREIAGDLIHLADAAEAPVKNLSITLTPTQSGTGDPSPTNVRPISGVDSVVVTRTGKNLWEFESHIETSSYVQKTFANYLPAGTYTLSAVVTTEKAEGTIDMRFRKQDGSALITVQLAANTGVRESKTFTLTEPAYRAYVYGSNTTSGYNGTWTDIQIEFGSSATDYEPYQGDTYSVSLPQTVYSGVVDVTGGTVTVTHAEITLDGSEGWGYQDGMFYTGGKHASIAYPDGYCDTYKVVKSYSAMQSGDFVISSTTTVIRIKDSRYTDAASFQANITQNPVKFIWQLATPQVITLTPQEITTLLDENYIWANSGVISLTYRQKFDVRLTEAVAKVLPTETASGDIVSITDGAEDIPVKALTVAVEPVQAGSGDPSPDNVRTITGWDAVNVVRCGKNLCADTLLNGQVGSNGGYASASNRVTNVTSNNALPQTHLPAGTYTISASGLDYVTVLTKDASKNIVDNFASSWHTLPFTFTLTADGYVLFTLRKSDNSDLSPSAFSVQIEAGSTATAYEQYIAPTTYPISLPSTVYGGTLDVTTGVMTVDRAIFTLDGSETYTVSGNGKRAQTIALKSLGIKYNTANNKTVDGGISNYLKQVTPDNTYGGTLGFSIGSDGTIHICDGTGSMTASGVKAMLANNNLILVLALATPQTITLDPTTISTLLGNNTIYADAGQVAVCYRADVGLYIDKRIAEVQALVLEGE